MSIGVIALVPDGWNDVVTTRHQLLRRLARHFPTVWMEPAAYWRECWLPGGARFLAPDGWQTPVANLDVFAPGWRHPAIYRRSWARALLGRSRLAAARHRLIEKGATQIVLYLWRDEYSDAPDLVKHDLSCYHIDDEYSFSDLEVSTSTRELELLRHVDQVIVHSPALMAKKGRINPHTELIPNGVDFKSFVEPQAEPQDLTAIPHPRIGYAGVIKKQLDLGLLVRLAQVRQKYSFVLVGPVLNVAGKESLLAELRRLPNVYFLGEKTAAALPAYVQHFDACLLCYELTDYTKYIYPLKLHEYLACGRPTISAPIDSVRQFGNVVKLARTDSEWLEAIDGALSNSGSGSTEADMQRAIARTHDWDTLADRIASLFTERLTTYGASKVV